MTHPNKPQPETEIIEFNGVTFEYTDQVYKDVIDLAPQPQPFPADVKVAPGIYQSREDYEANMAYDEARDEELLDELSSK